MANPKQGGGDNKSKREHHVVVRGSIASHTPVEEESQRRTERQEDESTHKAERDIDWGREKKKTWLEGIALIAVLAYTGVTTWQGCMLRESITNNIGLQHFFLECEQHMWIVSERPIPVGIRFDVGPEWFWLHHSFVDYLVRSDDAYLAYLKEYYKYTVMAPEVGWERL